jgi:glucose/arabinose dehydrogenase
MCTAAAAMSQSLELQPVQLFIPAKFQQYYDSARTVYLPKGYSISVFYTGGLSSPRFMAIQSDGTLCLADQGSSAVFALPDTNSDGVADTILTLASETDNAHSIAFHGGSLFAASPNRVWKYDTLSNGRYGAKQLFIDSLGATAEGSPNHVTRTILFDDTKQSIYISDGAPCNACREKDTNRATILGFNIDGTGRRIYASGLRNAVGLALDSSHQLWATVAERNNLGADLPGDLVTTISSDGFYGWPFALGNGGWEDFSATSEYKALLPLTHSDSVKVQTMEHPTMTVAAHSTPLGIVYCDDTAFGTANQHALFVAVHGSYPGTDGRIVANGSDIVRMKNENGNWIQEVFASGFLTDSIQYLRWARPAGIILDGKGNLYFSSDHTAPHATPAIFRISYDAKSSVVSGNVVTNRPTFAYDDHRITIDGVEGADRSIAVYDIIGRRMSAAVEEREAGYAIDLSSLPAGLCFIRVRCNGTWQTFKFAHE